MKPKELMSEYNFITKYAQTKKDGTKENWEESLDRIYGMHKVKYKKILDGEDGEQLQKMLDFCRHMESNRAVLSAQRVRQFADVREHRGILRHNGKLYNCASAYMDCIDRFSQTMFALLEGSGVGLSIQKEHISQLPVFYPNIGLGNDSIKQYLIEDSIEGWADAIKELIISYQTGSELSFIEFDYSDIRPKGALIAEQFLAPGPDGLENSISKIRSILDNALSDGPRQLKSIEIYDILMWIADAVLSGGVRRSATIMLFSYDDQDMLSAKIGNWMEENPQRRLSNNTVMLNRNTVTREQFDEVMKYVKEYGEPGFGFTNSIYTTFNPCYEIGKTPILMETMETGLQYCNLTEINGSYCDSEDKLMDSVRAATILGTLQAGYNHFEYLGEVTDKIVAKESLLGVSITGWMTNPDILFNEEIITRAAKLSIAVNEEVSRIIGINPAARITTTKPSGNASVLLGTTSGIHGEHAERYIRNIQTNKDEIGGQIFKSVNPECVEKSVWSKKDNIISFPLIADAKSIMKSELLGVNQLEFVKKAQEWWVKNGMVDSRSTVPGTTHNVSNTIQVPEGKWDEVADYIWENRNVFSGVSLIPSTGDLDYPQAPFQRVKTLSQIVAEYGDGVLYASGLIVDQFDVFSNLWEACDSLKFNVDLSIKEEEHISEIETNIIPNKEGKFLSFEDFSNKVINLVQNENSCQTIKSMCEEYFNIETNVINHTIPGDTLEERVLKSKKRDWRRRLKKYSQNYFNGDSNKAINCLKDVHLHHKWNKMNITIKDINWDKVDFSGEYTQSSDQVASACSGGKCEISF